MDNRCVSSSAYPSLASGLRGARRRRRQPWAAAQVAPRDGIRPAVRFARRRIERQLAQLAHVGGVLSQLPGVPVRVVVPHALRVHALRKRMPRRAEVGQRVAGARYGGRVHRVPTPLRPAAPQVPAHETQPQPLLRITLHAHVAVASARSVSAHGTKVLDALGEAAAVELVPAQQRHHPVHRVPSRRQRRQAHCAQLPNSPIAPLAGTPAPPPCTAHQRPHGVHAPAPQRPTGMHHVPHIHHPAQIRLQHGERLAPHRLGHRHRRLQRLCSAAAGRRAGRTAALRVSLASRARRTARPPPS